MAKSEPEKDAVVGRVDIPDLKQTRIEVELVGLTGLIVHRFGEFAKANLVRTQEGKAKTKKEPRVPDREFRDSLYVMGSDESVRWGDLSQCRFGFPTRGIKRAIVTAGQRFGDEHGTVLLGLLSMPTTMVEIVSPQPPTMREDLVRLSGPARTASISYRPEFNPWRMTVPIIFNSGWIRLEQVLNLIRLAGFSVGLGDWRVDRKGVHGQFEIGKLAVVESPPTA